MTIRELAIQAYETDQQLTKAAKEAFEFAKANGLILEEDWSDDDEHKWVPSKRSWQYTGYEIGKDGLDIKGEVYAGCSEYDYCHIYVPYESFNNLEAWAAQKKAEYAEKERQRAERVAARKAQEIAEAEEREKARYLKLKEKYEGAKV